MEFKTTLHRAIDTIKTYRDLGNPDVDTCNTILMHLAYLLDDEKKMITEAFHCGQSGVCDSGEEYYKEQL